MSVALKTILSTLSALCPILLCLLSPRNSVLADDEFNNNYNPIDDPIEVKMTSAPILNFAQGREARVNCTINRPPCFFLTSPVQFLFGSRECLDCDWVRLTYNERVLVDGNDDYYRVNVVSPTSYSTTFQLIFNYPRPRDNGELRCKLTIDPRYNLPRRSISVDRNIMVHN